MRKTFGTEYEEYSRATEGPGSAGMEFLESAASRQFTCRAIFCASAAAVRQIARYLREIEFKARGLSP